MMAIASSLISLSNRLSRNNWLSFVNSRSCTLFTFDWHRNISEISEKARFCLGGQRKREDRAIQKRQQQTEHGCHGTQIFRFRCHLLPVISRAWRITFFCSSIWRHGQVEAESTIRTRWSQGDFESQDEEFRDHIVQRTDRINKQNTTVLANRLNVFIWSRDRSHITSTTKSNW
jgi:hypothetical protein